LAREQSRVFAGRFLDAVLFENQVVSCSFHALAKVGICQKPLQRRANLFAATHINENAAPSILNEFRQAEALLVHQSKGTAPITEF
jgi:hypothetical protein